MAYLLPINANTSFHREQSSIYIFNKPHTGQVLCSKCTSCHLNATSSGLGCPAGSPADDVTCSCNAGFFGNGVNCSLCKSCSKNASTSGLCAAGSTVDSVACRCQPGFHGDGLVCHPCIECHPNASTTVRCNETSSVDTVACKCNAGFYGDGKNCSVCKTCDPQARINSACISWMSVDTTTCVCNAGYMGTGYQCSQCGAGFFSLAGTIFEGFWSSSVFLFPSIFNFCHGFLSLEINMFGPVIFFLRYPTAMIQIKP